MDSATSSMISTNSLSCSRLQGFAIRSYSKGLLSMFLSFPDDWNYSTRGLASICKEGVEAIGNTIKELEKAGYILRRQLRGANGRITDTEYVIYERPQTPDPPSFLPPGPQALPVARRGQGEGMNEFLIAE